MPKGKRPSETKPEQGATTITDIMKPGRWWAPNAQVFNLHKKKSNLFPFFPLKNFIFSTQFYASTNFFTFKLGMKIFYAKFNSITCTQRSRRRSWRRVSWDPSWTMSLMVAALCSGNFLLPFIYLLIFGFFYGIVIICGSLYSFMWIYAKNMTRHYLIGRCK